jgi:hypothetical protein
MGKKVMGGLVLAVCLLISYQAWQNARLDPETEALSMEAAEADGAVLQRERPNFTRTDPVRRRYEWRTDQGQKVVTCMRDMVFFGGWSCEAVPGSIGSF